MRFGLVCLLSILFAVSANAGSIVAVVNDVPISSYDVAQRAKLMQLMQPEIQDVKRLEKQALEQLIADTLKIQEAEKNKITVSEEELAGAVARLEEQNKMPAGALEKELTAKGISKETLEKQLRTDLMWLSVLRQHKDSVPDITDKAIQNRLNQMKKELAKESFVVAEILVKEKADADQIVVDIQNGQPFDEVAKKKSLAKTAAKGGLTGWVAPDYYAPEVVEIIRSMQQNQLSRPIQTADGYYVILMLEYKPAMGEKMTVWELAQLAVSPTQTIDVLPQVLALRDCDSFDKWGQEKALPESTKRGFVGVQQLPPELVKLLESKKLKTSVGPVSMGQADVFFMKCQVEERSMLPEKEVVRGQLEMEQMMLLTDRLMNQIKRYAVIEYKD